MTTTTAQFLPPILPAVNAQGQFDTEGMRNFFQKIVDLLGTKGTVASMNQTITDLQASLQPISNGSQWPVGSIFISLTNASPNAQLGFGTWTSTGTGTLLGETVYGWKRIV
jgi:hypothetical protein